MSTQRFQVIHLHNLQIFIEEISKRCLARNTIKVMMKNLSLDVKESNLQEIMDFANFVEKRGSNFPKKTSQESSQYHWAFGEQKLFCIFLPYFFCYYGLSPLHFSQRQLSPLQSIFISKSSIQLYFQIKYFDSLTNNFKIEWTHDDHFYLKNIVNQANEEQQENIKWKNIAVKLFVQNKGQVFHSPRDCRQMWTNHLNPKISKDSWDLKEDYELFSFIKEHGCKWSLISKKMKSMRTEHMVKNRANSMAKKYRFKTKRLNDNQVEHILEDLSKKLALLSGQVIKQTTIAYTQIQEQSSQQKGFTQIAKQEPKNEEFYYSIEQIYSVLDLSPERIVIASREIDQNWQYNEEQPANYPFFGNVDVKNCTFDESFQKDLTYPVDFFCFDI